MFFLEFRNEFGVNFFFPNLFPTHMFASFRLKRNDFGSGLRQSPNILQVRSELDPNSYVFKNAWNPFFRVKPGKILIQTFTRNKTDDCDFLVPKKRTIYRVYTFENKTGIIKVVVLVTRLLWTVNPPRKRSKTTNTFFDGTQNPQPKFSNPHSTLSTFTRRPFSFLGPNQPAHDWPNYYIFFMVWPTEPSSCLVAPGGGKLSIRGRGVFSFDVAQPTLQEGSRTCWWHVFPNP